MRALKFYCLLIVIICAAIYADYSLIDRVTNYYVESKVDHYDFLKYLWDYKSFFSCDFNPICFITIKGLVTDHINFYILSPTAALINQYLQLDVLQEKIPSLNIINAISIIHAIVGIIAGFFIASSKLRFRRIGVILFELRYLLDDLGKIVSKELYGVEYEYVKYSETQKITLYIDIFCNFISIVWLLVVINSFIIETEFMQLPVFTRYNKKYIQELKNSVILDVIIIAILLSISCIAWNYYTNIFEEKFEVYGTEFIKSSIFLAVAWMWKLFNIHALIQYTMIAIFSNNLIFFMKKAPMPVLFSLLYICFISEIFIRIVFPD
ncbi:hypothetical protein PVAND_013827 [Polypedilum vanderplanki]|uniref:Uncharacterized protein n=1 Tax=Polypedilum vanderplanki TaxID=319348 RepID=A0A9J6CQJ7_POLVA|nr:hypothetical protein PVAND_013827 [Polypedilum vanderplanki]